MKVEILKLGVGKEIVKFPESHGDVTVGEVLKRAAEKNPAFAAAGQRVEVNNVNVNENKVLKDGDVITLTGKVRGG